MIRAPIWLIVASALLLPGLTPTRAMAAAQVPVNPAQMVVKIETRDVEQTEETGADGSVLIGGHFGAGPGCPGVQAFVKKIDTTGSLAWLRSASAGKDCDGDGQSDGGDPFFEGMTSLDPVYIEASTLRDVAYAADGSSFEAGQVLVAWENGGQLTAGWGAFLLHRSPLGALLADYYVGAQPSGTPTDVQSCIVLCSALSGATLDQWGGRVVALAEDEATGTLESVVFGGWYLSVANQAVNEKDVFLISLTPDLTTVNGAFLRPLPGKDEPLDAVVDGNGNVYVTGYYGSAHDIFVGRFELVDVGGVVVLDLIYTYLAGGPLDDDGEIVTITAAGEIEVFGTFTDSAYFPTDSDPINLLGEGPTPFRALLTPELNLILAEVVGSGGESGGAGSASALSDPDTLKAGALPRNGGTGLPQIPQTPELPEGSHHNVPSAIHMIVGQATSGTNPSLVAASDEEYLRLQGEPQTEYDKVEVLFEIPIHPGAQVLNSIGLEFRSDYCTSLTISVGGGTDNSGMFYEIGGVDICPFDEPLITIEIPADVAENLGYSATLPQPEEPLLMLCEMKVYSIECSTCLSPGEDEEINSGHCNSQYP